MRKIWVVAQREYLAAVKSKSFIVGVILLPIMMSGGVIMQKVGEKIGDTSTRKIAIMDRTPGEQLLPVVEQAVEQRNTKGIFDSSGRQVKAKFAIERVDPAKLQNEANLDGLRLELSKRVNSGELMAFVEMGPDLLKPATQPSAGQGDDAADRARIRYSSNRPTYRDFTSLLQSALPEEVIRKRLSEAGLTYSELQPLLKYPQVVDRGLASEKDGKISYETAGGRMAPFVVPMVMLLLMFVVVLIGASPMTGNVIEEKQLRIAEVLLGSVTPFELMMGKLLGGVGVALTLAGIYFGGAYGLAVKQGYTQYVSTASAIWFICFTAIGTLMYGSLFVAAGAAVTNVKEAQSIMMPVMLLIMLPVLMLGNMIQDPSGPLAVAASFFPTSAPMVMTARLAIPPGVPVWQMMLSIAVTLISTVAIIWAAGRIFRIGILIQGQGADIRQMLRWIISG